MKLPDDFGPELLLLTERLTQSVGQLAKIGLPDIGTSPHETVLTGEGFRLLRYHSGEMREEQCAVLIVYALVNRPWVLDLEPDRSTIARLVASGLDVFLIEWEDPLAQDQNRGFSDYACRMLDECVDTVNCLRNENTVNLLGVCQGGTFSLCYSALYGHKVRNLVTMVTPVDFHTEDNVLSKWVRKVDLDSVEDCYGNVPGNLLNAVFVSLQPFRLGSKKYLDLVDLADNPEGLRTFARMERWIADSPDQAGRAFCEFVRDLFQRNALVQGELVLDGNLVDLGKIHCPVLNVYALADHLVPASASRPLAGHVASADYSELEFDGGHIGIYVSRSAQEIVPPAIAAWLQARS
tara:strand:- start:1386 stop:2438 length:1053 start_codon:yes stop_codon:yes gene_type:complete